MKEKWFVWTDVPRPEEPATVLDSLDDVFKFIERFAVEFGFNTPTQVIMLKRIVFSEKKEKLCVGDKEKHE